MKKRYPKIVRTLAYKRLDADRVEVEELTEGLKYEVVLSAARLMKRLDGKTDPHSIPTDLTPAQVDELIENLNECDLLEKSRLRWALPFYVLLPLIYLKRIRLVRYIAIVSNWVLMLTWIPLLIAGVACYGIWQHDIEYGGWVWGFVLGYITGLVLHEFGHAFAGYAYKARVFEMGVGLMFFICPLFYVILTSNAVPKRMQRIQIYAAGIETNFWLCGLYLIFATVLFPSLGGVFWSAALLNLFLGLTNLLGVFGLDGGKILSELLGDSNLLSYAQMIVTDRDARRQLARRGVTGYAVMGLCYFWIVMQIGWVAIIVSMIWEGVKLFL